MIASAGRRTIIDRMLGAALLETETYEEAALTASVWSQAALVVAVTAVATGVGFLGSGLTGLVAGFLAAVLGWCLGALSGFRPRPRRYQPLLHRRPVSRWVRPQSPSLDHRVFLHPMARRLLRRILRHRRVARGRLRARPAPGPALAPGSAARL